MTGGRWRRIVLGDVLAGHVVRVEEVVRKEGGGRRKAEEAAAERERGGWRKELFLGCI